MRTATLTRTRSGDEGTFGCFRSDRGFVCFTGELPWRENAIGTSCIPPGRYRCTWRYSPAHGMCYHVEGVPGRTDVEIHAANWMGDVTIIDPATEEPRYRSQLRGCIAPGTGIEDLLGQRAVVNSKLALLELEAHFAREPFELTIIPCR